MTPCDLADRRTSRPAPGRRRRRPHPTYAWGGADPTNAAECSVVPRQHSYTTAGVRTVTIMTDSTRPASSTHGYGPSIYSGTSAGYWPGPHTATPMSVPIR